MKKDGLSETDIEKALKMADKGEIVKDMHSFT